VNEAQLVASPWSVILSGAYARRTAITTAAVAAAAAAAAVHVVGCVTFGHVIARVDSAAVSARTE